MSHDEERERELEKMIDPLSFWPDERAKVLMQWNTRKDRLVSLDVIIQNNMISDVLIIVSRSNVVKYAIHFHFKAFFILNLNICFIFHRLYFSLSNSQVTNFM